LRPRPRQQGRPVAAPRLRPRQVPPQSGHGPSGRRAASRQCEDRRGCRRLARVADTRHVARGRPGVIDARTDANERLLAAEAERTAELSALLAERFVAGGRLLAVGAAPQDRSDAHHVAVEFVHPVIVGKRALPALALGVDELPVLAEPGDAIIAFGADAGGP